MSANPIHPGTRAKVYERDAMTCRYCGRECVHPKLCGDSTPWECHATIDHVIPRIEGGSSRIDNLVLACRGCNTLKNRRPVEWLLERIAA